MPPRYFNKLSVKKLIRLVKKNPCLYDNKAKKAFKAEDIEKIWKKIAKECSLEVAQVKRKWTNLRRDYMSDVTKKTDKSKYRSELNFLYNFVLDGQDVSNDEVKIVDEVIKKEPRDTGYDNEYENRPSTSSGRQSALSGYDHPSVAIYPSNGSLQIDDDELKPYFESIYRSTKKLPRDLQLSVKTKFSEFINAAEATANERDSQ